MDGNGNVTKQHLCRRIEVKSLQVDIDTGRNYLVLVFNSVTGEEKHVTVPRVNLTRQKFLGYLDIGMDIREHAVSSILKFIFEQEKQLSSQKLLHNQIGFGGQNGDLVYKLSECIGVSSVYDGDLDLGPAGDLAGWQAVVEEQVLGNINLELALALGFTAVVASFISQATKLDVVIFHIVGNSTTGKTTAAKLAVSPFGNPSPTSGKPGLVSNWDGSDVAITSVLRHVNGVPIVLDESSMKTSNDFAQLIYRIASGTDKKRLDKEANQTQTATFSGAIISTGEHSLLERANRNTGLKMRLFEIGNRTWTRDAPNADALQAGLLRNHGVAGLSFVRHLMDLGVDAVKELWQYLSAFLKENSNVRDQFSARVADKFALIAVAAHVAKSSVVPNLNVEAIVNSLVETSNECGENRDIAAEAYEYVWECVSRYQAKFKTNSYIPVGECLGRIIYPDNGIIDDQPSKPGKPEKIYLPKQTLDAWLKEGLFPGRSVIIPDWDKNGWLEKTQDGKRTQKKTIQPGNRGIDVYVIKNKDLQSTSRLNTSTRTKKVCLKRKDTLSALFKEE